MVKTVKNCQKLSMTVNKCHNCNFLSKIQQSNLLGYSKTSPSSAPSPWRSGDPPISSRWQTFSFQPSSPCSKMPSLMLFKNIYRWLKWNANRNMGMYEGLNAQPYFPQLYFSKLYSFKLFLALTSTNICELVDNFHCLLFNYFTIKRRLYF